MIPLPGVRVERPWRRPLNADRVLRPVGAVEIDAELCKGCGFCVEFCPLGVLEMSRSINRMGYQYPRVRPGMEDRCVCCGMCERICPEMAIRVREVGYRPVEVA